MKLITRSLILASLVACAPSHAEPAFFASIDGLQPDLLESLTSAGKLTEPRGLGWLRSTGTVVERATPIVTSLTAASHVSTITCSTPSKHGITSNSLMRDGQRLSGFSAPFFTEPLWRAASRQGKKVLSLAYAGADGSTPDRAADYNIGYPDDALLGSNSNVALDFATLAPAAGWTLDDANQPQDPQEAPTWREATITIKLNNRTGETRTLHALVGGHDGIATWARIDTDKNLANGYLGTLEPGVDARRRIDAFFTEDDAESTTRGFKRRAFLRALPRAAGGFSIYVSKTSYNNAVPTAFRQMLDDANLVWPDYGVRGELSLSDYLEAQSMIDRFLTDVAVQTVPRFPVDVVLFYQPLIDSVGHKLQARLPLPFDPNGQDEVTRTYVEAFQIIDQNVSRLLSLTASSPTVALMGDHGMDPIRKTVNLGALLPRDHVGKVEVVTSGSLVMLYDAPAEAGQASNEGAARRYGADLAHRMALTTLDGAPILGTAHERGDGEWQYGEATWAFTSGEGFYWSYSPMSDELYADPGALGMHGHDVTLPQMATSLLFQGPNIPHREIPTGSLIDAVPSFTHLIGIAPPADCMGRSLF